MQREVIKWIQTLDLSFPVHNPRRDLMNGFVVAEILSRYDKNVSMHSFDTGSAIARRLDNWKQIRKILQRLKCASINDELVELVIQGRDGAARRILEELYMFLTKRRLHPTPADNGAVGAAASVGTVGASAKVAAAVEQPAFMRPTAAKLLRDENDATKERFASLTGKTDELKRRQVNEAALETHEVGLQAQKFQEPDRFKPKPRPPNSAPNAKDGSQSARGASGTRRGSATNGGTSTSRTRQKIQAARQLAVRGIDDSILATFQQRQEHEKEEQFKAQFDPAEDLATALSRVCVRPLNQAGLVEALDEFSANANGEEVAPGASDELHAGGSSGHEVSATNAAAATGDYFCKFVDHRAVVPAEAKRLVWGALKDVAGNIAKHLQQRAEEAYHLAFSLSFAFKRGAHVAGGAAADAEDADAALDFIATVGHQWQKIDLDAPTQTAATILIPALADFIAGAPPELLQRLGAVLGAFCNPRDVESFKRLINAVAATAGPAEPTVTPLFVASLLETVDPKLCLGLDDVLEYYAAAYVHSTTVVERACALRLLRALAECAPMRVEPFLPAIRCLTQDADWEVRLCALHLATALYASNRAAASSAAGAGGSSSNAASPTSAHRSSSVAASGEESPEAGSATPGLSGGGGPSPKCLDEDETTDLLVACFDSLAESNSLVQRASLCAVGPRLDYDAMPALCDAFVDRLLSLNGAAIADMLRVDGPVSAMPGRVIAAHVAGNVVATWNAVAVACALVNARTNRSTYDFLSVLEPLLANAELGGENRGVWFAVAEQSKHDVVDAVYNPASLRGVSEAQMQQTGRLAGSIAVRLYQELSGEDDDDLHQQALASEDDAGGAETYARKLQERAIDWMQAAL